MGKYRSDDSDDDYSRKPKKKKKRRARSRTRSSSDSGSSRYSSSKAKKSKKKHRKSSRSRSRSADRRRGDGRSRRSRSRSVDRHASVRGRSYSRSPSHRNRRRSRSPTDRRQISPSYSRSRRSRSRGRRSRSYSRERRSRSRSGGTRNSSRRSSPDRRREREASYSTASPSNIKGLSLSELDGATSVDHLTPAEQAEQRMRLALKAAAAADEQLRLRNTMDDHVSASAPSLGVLDRMDFSGSVAAIENDSFVSSAFSSSRSSKVKEESMEPRLSHDDAIFGSLAVTGFTLQPDLDTRPIDMDPDAIMHPSLYCDPDEKMDRWMQRLSQLRRKKLEGEAM